MYLSQDDATVPQCSLIDKEQKCDIHLLNKIKKNPTYTTKIFHGGGKSYDLIVKHYSLCHTSVKYKWMIIVRLLELFTNLSLASTKGRY